MLKSQEEKQVALVDNTHEKSRETKQRILEEEEYLKVLNKIVERDFYPELANMKLQSAYLDALDSNDIEKLREIQLQLEKSTPLPRELRETPKLFDTCDPDPTQQETQDEEADETTNLDKKISLDKFLAKNTSEDNASFEKIMVATREKHREKHNWLYEKQRELHERLDASKALPSSFEAQILAIETKSNNLDTWTYVAKNALMYPPEGVEKSSEELLNEKGKKEKEICYKNTRFREDPFNSNAGRQALMKASEEQASMRKAVGKIGVDGKMEEGAGGETPGMRGYQFVGTPSMTPGVDASPLMTWGAIEGTPMRIDSTPVPSFKMAEPPRREKLAHSLVEKASKQHRDKRKKEMTKAAHASFLSPKNTPRELLLKSERISRLSPAAQKLIKSSVKVSSLTDSSLRESYSTPSPFYVKRATPKAPYGRVKTPLGRVKTPVSTTGEGSSITDDLLQLPNT